ncbi:hypothetical protein CRG98_020752 [Punica granatum]|uniref:Uncharacterized protein n=1 Tax=Punica granatum TaxID=22663 RepID=A0A2I0JSK4_PUNGR|nr:hypothetical protein CRG98_020752 [Punica granatum]
MQFLVASRLPRFSLEQSAIVKGSFDFIGMNYNTTNYAQDAPQLGSSIQATQQVVGPIFQLSAMEFLSVLRTESRLQRELTIPIKGRVSATPIGAVVARIEAATPWNRENPQIGDSPDSSGWSHNRWPNWGCRRPLS